MKLGHGAQLLAGAVVAALATAGVFAGPATPGPTAAAAQQNFPGAGSVLQMLFALALVIGLVLVAAWIVKRLGHGRATSARPLKIVGSTALGARERIALVEIADTWLVVGVAPGQVRTLHVLPKQATAEANPLAASTESNFANWLKHALERRHGA